MRRGNQSDPNTNGQYRMVGDHLGSTSLIVDTDTPPTVVHRQYYKPYGEVAKSYGSSRTTVGYTGQRLDTDSGLMYYGARYYDPMLSYFIQADPTVPDPAEAKDYNRYLYVRGNPLRYIDTSGYGPDDHYVFVYGCSQGCGDDTAQRNAWIEYTLLLRMMFDAEGWGDLAPRIWSSRNESSPVK